MVESEPEEYLLVMYIWYGFVYRLDLVWNNRQGKCENPQGQLLPGAGEGAGCPLHDARHGQYETPGENHLSIFYLGLEKVLDVQYMMQGMDGMKRQVRIIYLSSTWGWRRCWMFST